MIKDKTILITGGTGSFGHKATQQFLKDGAKKIIIYSRDEYKQMLMKNEFKDERVHFVIGDVRDIERLKECAKGADIIMHAAAMKHVDICEQNETEAIKTNVQGSKNVVEAALHNEVPITINLSADKAVYPAGVYGKTKASSEEIFTKANKTAKEMKKKCRFASLRYSNVIGSRGSVVEIFEEKLNKNQTVIVINDKMIRLVITQEEVVEMAKYAAEKMKGGEIFLVQSPVLRISDLAKAMQKKIGKGNVEMKNEIREGEKYDAVLISEEESKRTITTPEDYLVIMPQDKETDKNIFLKTYGNNMFQKGEYGTHNARYLKQDEIIKMIYGG